MSQRHERKTSSASRFLFTTFSFLIIVASAFGEGGSVSLAWDPTLDDHVAGYRLHYGLGSGNYGGTVDVGTNASGTISGLNEGATYFIVVTAYTADGLESLPSNEVSFTVEVTGPQAEPGLPSGPTVPDQPTLPAPAAPSEPPAPAAGLLGNSPPAPEPVVFGNTTYNGLISDDKGNLLDGVMTMRTTAEGLATGQIVIDGKRSRWASAFDNLGRLAFTIHRRTLLAAITVTLEPGLEPGRIVGTLTDGTSSATIELERIVASEDRSFSLQGRYTMTFQPEGAAAVASQGYGIGFLNVSPYGAVRLSAILADGTKLSSGGGLDNKAAFSFHIPAYSNRGFLAGKVSFGEKPDVSDAGRTLLWSKPFRPASRFKPALAIPLPVRVSRFPY